MISDEDRKRWVVNSIIGASVGLFAVGRYAGSSTTVPLQWRFRIQEILGRHFSFTRRNPAYTALTYAVNHSTYRHLGFNIAMMWMLGGQLVDNEKVKTRDLVGLTGVSAVAAAAAEAAILTSPLVGASGVVMGYLSALAVLDPGKAWLMIFPIPGIPVTTLQLCQATAAGHVGTLIYRGRSVSRGIAIRGHLGAILAGYLYAKIIFGSQDFDLWRESRMQWERTLTSAELVLYWAYLTVKLALPMPFSTEGDIGDLKTKQRFIKRIWKDDF